MLVDCLTKSMHPSLLNRYMQDYKYSFKYDDQLNNTKRAAAKERKQQREERLKQGGKKQQNRERPAGSREGALRESSSAPQPVLFVHCCGTSSTSVTATALSTEHSEFTPIEEMPQPPGLAPPARPVYRSSATWGQYQQAAGPEAKACL